MIRVIKSTTEDSPESEVMNDSDETNKNVVIRVIKLT